MDEEYRRKDMRLNDMAQDLLDSNLIGRALRRDCLLEERAKLRGPGIKIRVVNQLAQHMARHCAPAVERPWTVESLRREALALLHYSRTGWSNPYDTEYYSA